MKKYAFLIGAIVSSLAHAAAQPSRPKKINCVRVAQIAMEEMADLYPHAMPDQAGLLAVHIGRGGFARLATFSCWKALLYPDERTALKDAKKTAKMIEDRLNAIEFCVQESPEYASNHFVREATTIFRSRNLAVWQRCADAQAEAVRQYAANYQAKRQQEAEKEQAREYLAEHCKKAQSNAESQHSPAD